MKKELHVPIKAASYDALIKEFERHSIGKVQELKKTDKGYFAKIELEKEYESPDEIVAAYQLILGITEVAERVALTDIFAKKLDNFKTPKGQVRLYAYNNTNNLPPQVLDGVEDDKLILLSHRFRLYDVWDKEGRGKMLHAYYELKQAYWLEWLSEKVFGKDHVEYIFEIARLLQPDSKLDKQNIADYLQYNVLYVDIAESIKNVLEMNELNPKAVNKLKHFIERGGDIQVTIQNEINDVITKFL